MLEVNYESLKDRGVFIVGNARSGTSVFCDCLNLSDDIYLLREANLFVNHAREDFVEFFNAQHERFKNSRSKGTYLPPAANPDKDGLAVLARLAKRHRLVGEKITFGANAQSGERFFQDLFFDFHAKYFYDSTYLIIIRQPAEVVWSMSKMWPNIEIDVFIESWLRTIRVAIDVYQSFPKAYVLFWKNVDVEAVARVGRMLGTRIRVPAGMLDKRHIHSSLARNDLPIRLGAYNQFLNSCQEIYVCLRDSFHPRNFTYSGVDNEREFLQVLHRKATFVLHTLTGTEGDRKPAIASRDLDSAERFVPRKSDPAQWGEHMSRYLFASSFVRSKVVLDVGCGTGYGSQILVNRGATQVVAVDVSPDAIAYARAHYSHSGLTFLVMSVTALELPSQSYDVVVMLEVIEHIKDVARCLNEVSRVLTDDGILILSTPNQAEHPGELFNPFHVREFDRLELMELLRLYFRNVKFFAFGFFAGMYALPIENAELANAATDTTLLSARDVTEPPFFLAICSQSDLSWLRSRHQFLPFTMNRGDYARSDQAWQVKLVRPHVNRALRQAVRPLIDRGRFEDVLPFLEALHRNKPDEAEWTYLLALCLHHLDKDLNRALEYYCLALEHGFDEFWVRLNRGRLLAEMGDYDPASVDLERVLALQPAYEPVRAEHIGLLVRQARQLLEIRQFDVALRLVRLVVHIRPAEAEAHYLVAFSLQMLGRDADEALQHYSMALESGFDEFWVKFNRGTLLRDLHLVDAAQNDLECALALNPEHEGVAQVLQQLLAGKKA